jgi:hypothetical protein
VALPRLRTESRLVKSETSTPLSLTQVRYPELTVTIDRYHHVPSASYTTVVTASSLAGELKLKIDARASTLNQDVAVSKIIMFCFTFLSLKSLLLPLPTHLASSTGFPSLHEHVDLTDPSLHLYPSKLSPSEHGTLKHERHESMRSQSRQALDHSSGMSHRTRTT